LKSQFSVAENKLKQTEDNNKSMIAEIKRIDNLNKQHIENMHKYDFCN